MENIQKNAALQPVEPNTMQPKNLQNGSNNNYSKFFEQQEDNKILEQKDEKIVENTQVDQSVLQKAEQNETESPLAHPGRFWFIVIWLSICHFNVGFNQGFIGAF